MIDQFADTLAARQVLREFLEWCDEQKIELATARPTGIWYAPLVEDRERTLDRYLGIDAAQLEKERAALVAHLSKKASGVTK
jgi:hypothetical protein